MKLTLAYYHIRDIRFDKRTEIKDGVLFINQDELRSLLLNDENYLYVLSLL